MNTSTYDSIKIATLDDLAKVSTVQQFFTPAIESMPGYSHALSDPVFFDFITELAWDTTSFKLLSPYIGDEVPDICKRDPFILGEMMCNFKDAQLSVINQAIQLNEEIKDESIRERRLAQENRKQKIGIADQAFSAFDFGGDVEIVNSSGWDTSDPNDLTAILIGEEYGSSEPPFKISFHVRFDPEGKIDEVYALDMQSGNDIGFYPPARQAPVAPTF